MKSRWGQRWGIKTDAKFLPTVVETGLFKWAKKSRILLTEKFPFTSTELIRKALPSRRPDATTNVEHRSGWVSFNCSMLENGYEVIM